MSFESFILLSPSAFVIPTIITHLDPTSETAEELDNPADLSWTHHLHLYAFPPFSAIRMPALSSEPMPPPHTAVHIATLDLPRFHVDIMQNIPPPRLTIRTDPPPRHTIPAHPEHAPAPFQPMPESGIIVMEVFCQLPDVPDPHYVICLLKSTLLQYLPAPTSPLLFQAFPRPAPIVQWQTLAPRVRMFGPDLEPSCAYFTVSRSSYVLIIITAWVCYVYQNRYIIPRTDDEDDHTYLRLYDFDPLRVRKEKCDRANKTEPISPPPKRRSSSTPTSPPLDGDRHGVHLVTVETVLPGDHLLVGEVRTGRDLPYMYVEKVSTADVALLDGERVVAVEVSV